MDSVCLRRCVQLQCEIIKIGWSLVAMRNITKFSTGASLYLLLLIRICAPKAARQWCGIDWRSQDQIANQFQSAAVFRAPLCDFGSLSELQIVQSPHCSCSHGNRPA